MPDDTGVNPLDDVYSALAEHIAGMQARDAASHSIARQALQVGDITHDQYGEFLSMPHEERLQFAANLINKWKQNQPAASTPTPAPNVIIPDTGAAAYWYVDPRAKMDPTIAALEQWRANLRPSSGSSGSAWQILQ